MQYKLIERPSVNFENREITPKYIILHCIGFDLDTAMNILLRSREDGGGGVAAHYLIPQVTGFSLYQHFDYPIYSMVTDNLLARHAGVSYWGEDSMLNDQSIGIEFSSPNYANALHTTTDFNWFHFDQFQHKQIEAGITLIKSLIDKYNIQPENILGHSDIAPWRTDATGAIITGKTDPGSTFPWNYLASRGIGVWPCGDRIRTGEADLSIENIQQLLLEYGYNLDLTGVLDSKTRHVLNAFQMRFMPEELFFKPSARLVIYLENLIDRNYEYTPYVNNELRCHVTI